MAVPPLPEQQKIASILSTVDDAIHKTDEIIAKSRQLKKGLMQQLLTKGIGHTKFQKTEIGEIPEEWEVVRLGGGEDVSQIIMGQSPPSSTYNEDGTGLPFIQGNAEFGEVYPEPRMHTSNPIKVAEKNDILVSVRAPVGDVNLSPFRCCIGRGLSAVRTDPSRLNHLFTFHYMKNTTNRLTSLAMGSTFMAVRKDDLESFKISLPSLPEQERIASILSTADSNTHSEGWRREKLMEVKKGLMQVLLTGKVRVKVI